MTTSTLDDSQRVDVARMQRHRMEQLHAAMATAGIDALVLLGNTNVMYATGDRWAFGDHGRGHIEQPVAVVLAGDDTPHLFTSARSESDRRNLLPADHVHAAVFLDFDEGVEQFGNALRDLVPPGARIAIDEWSQAMRRDSALLFAGGPPPDAGRVVSAAKLIKTADEVALLRRGLDITNRAIADAQAQLAPGVRQVDLTARFLQTIFEEGADANILDPMWQVMPASIADGPWTTTGGLACPLLSSERAFAKGDVVWVDVGISNEGFHSDFGRTWIVGQDPDARQRSQFAKWREIMDAVLAVTKAGARASDLTAAAIELHGGTKPWMPHFYLGHGLGIDSAEMPFVGSDLGEEFDASMVLASGMVLVLEPIVWEDGASGYRSEEIFLITDDGWEQLSDYPYAPY
jgi:Xaa-Pro aminopeptidase